jgi:hypothetical protein
LLGCYWLPGPPRPRPASIWPSSGAVLAGHGWVRGLRSRSLFASSPSCVELSNIGRKKRRDRRGSCAQGGSRLPAGKLSRGGTGCRWSLPGHLAVKRRTPPTAYERRRRRGQHRRTSGAGAPPWIPSARLCHVIDSVLLLIVSDGGCRVVVCLPGIQDRSYTTSGRDYSRRFFSLRNRDTSLQSRLCSLAKDMIAFVC